MICSLRNTFRYWWTQNRQHAKATARLGSSKMSAIQSPHVCVEDISFHPERKVDKGQILSLAFCPYIEEGHNVLALGTTWGSKTYLTCALGVATNRRFCTVKYVRLPDLLTEISFTHNNGLYLELMRKYRKVKLPILNEWLLCLPKKERDPRSAGTDRGQMQYSIYKFFSQLDTPSWHENLCDNIIYDTIH